MAKHQIDLLASLPYSAQSTKISAHPDSNFSLQQSCSNLALQICHDKSGSLKQACRSDEVTTRRTCSKFVTSNSLQTIAKTEYAHNLGLELATSRFLR
ncbi:hypothetical protein AVEN_80680-1 [Araneus ventricosus]|uniref:Uncharacterized protein n=1 Tax=Araneus ventricosus TaxID=182803 RepID=A0A4Y2PIT1_ARAVE|nr:hypothetical protein AVEN_80680-1 [Araneus ventricosus]